MNLMFSTSACITLWNFVNLVMRITYKKTMEMGWLVRIINLTQLRITWKSLNERFSGLD